MRQWLLPEKEQTSINCRAFETAASCLTWLMSIDLGSEGGDEKEDSEAMSVIGSGVAKMYEESFVQILCWEVVGQGCGCA